MSIGHEHRREDRAALPGCVVVHASYGWLKDQGGYRLAAGRKSMIPDVLASGLLPQGRHVATLGDIRETFVDNAPFSDERKVILRGLELHLALMRQIFASGRAWINGGFVTHKTWSAPKDVDIAYVLSAAAINALDSDSGTRLASLVTLQGVASMYPILKAPRVQPMGGLLDAFILIEERLDLQIWWDALWCTVMGEDGNPMDGARKGYLEVIW